VGGPLGAAMIGGALLGGGASTGVQKATTGEVDWGRVGVDAIVGAAAGGAGAWAGGAARAAHIANPLARGAAVGATQNVVGGMVSRSAYGENPFDPEGMRNDLLLGGGTGAAGGRLGARRLADAPEPPFVQRGFSYGGPGPNALGSTDKFGNITIRPGLSEREFVETLRHETVHSVLSPKPGSLLANVRADLHMAGYQRSNLLRYAEEALAEGYATRSVRQGLRFPLAEGYVTPGGLSLESAAVGGTAYVGHEMVSGD
jgi:hypothetical protein